MNEFSAKTFQRKIEAFCQLRLSPVLKVDALHRLSDYLSFLIQARRSAPRMNGKTDWDAVAAASGIDAKELAANARRIDPALDAIARWIRDTRLAPAAEKPDVRKPGKTSRAKAAAPAPAVAPAAPQVPEPPLKPKPASVASARVNVEFPEALFKVWEDPADFAEALQLHLRRHGETYWTLYRGIIGPDDLTDKNTLLSWIEGRRVPRSIESFEMLSRIERRYRLPEGYFKSKLPHPSRSASGFNLSGMERAERRRIAWHLPEDFNSLPFQKREEIVDWVRRVIISGSTDYRKFQAAAAKQRYAIRFPGVSYGGRAPRDGKITVPANYDETWVEDPDLLSGVIDAPPALAMEMADLVRFKTSALTSIGFQRNGVWGEETASQKSNISG